MYMAQSLTLNMQGIGLPYTGADEDCLVAVTEQVIDADGSARYGYWAGI